MHFSELFAINLGMRPRQPKNFPEIILFSIFCYSLIQATKSCGSGVGLLSILRVFQITTHNLSWNVTYRLNSRRKTFAAIKFCGLGNLRNLSTSGIQYFKGKKYFWKKVLWLCKTAKLLHFAGMNFCGSWISIFRRKKYCGSTF